MDGVVASIRVTAMVTSIILRKCHLLLVQHEERLSPPWMQKYCILTVIFVAELYHGILPDTLSILIPDGSDVVDVQCHIERVFPIRTFVPRPRLGFPFS